jgi:hypothetical protein
LAHLFWFCLFCFKHKKKHNDTKSIGSVLQGICWLRRSCLRSFAWYYLFLLSTEALAHLFWFCFFSFNTQKKHNDTKSIGSVLQGICFVLRRSCLRSFAWYYLFLLRTEALAHLFFFVFFVFVSSTTKNHNETKSIGSVLEGICLVL